MPMNLRKSVKELRGAANMTQKELAERVEKSPSWVVDLERGKTAPKTVEDVVDLADALKAEPIELLAAKLADQMELPEVGPEVREAAEIWFKRKAPDEGSTIKRAAPRSRIEIEEEAERVAHAVFPEAYEAVEAIPVQALMKGDQAAMGAFRDYLDAPVTFAAVPPGDPESRFGAAIGGMSKYENDRFFIHIREGVLQAAKNGDGRSRFTIAHEIAHCCIHAKEMKQAEEAVFRDYNMTASDSLASGLKIYESPEWQANTFASAFLMPEEPVERWLRMKKCAQADTFSIQEFSKKFDVSFQAARIRMERLFAKKGR